MGQQAGPVIFASASCAGLGTSEIPGVLPSVAICIPTFRRADGLRKLLEFVARVEYAGELAVIVVENDAEHRCGEAIVKSLAASYPFPLHAVIEPVRGQSYAYNRAFAVACRLRNRPEYIAVLDDDEFPAACWLKRIVAMARRVGADVVGGPVFPVFENPDNWLAKTGHYEPKRYPSGLVPIIYGAGNMLVRRVVLEGYLDEPFPNEFAFTGGSDLCFFKRCQRDGHSFAWADDAHVFETVPISRLTLPWLMKRAFRSGNDLARIDKRFDPTARQAAVRWIKGAGLFALGVVLIPLTLPFGRFRLVKSMRMSARGLGRLAAEFAIWYEEYR